MSMGGGVGTTRLRHLHSHAHFLFSQFGLSRLRADGQHRTCANQLEEIDAVIEQETGLPG